MIRPLGPRYASHKYKDKSLMPPSAQCGFPITLCTISSLMSVVSEKNGKFINKEME